ALDAGTGQERWRHDPQVSDDWLPYTAACRGVVYYDGAGAAASDAVGAASPAPTDARAPATQPRRPTPAPAPATPTTTAPASGAPAGACAARIIEGTLDGRLIAVDAASGRPC